MYQPSTCVFKSAGQVLDGAGWRPCGGPLVPGGLWSRPGLGLCQLAQGGAHCPRRGPGGRPRVLRPRLHPHQGLEVISLLSQTC